MKFVQKLGKALMLPVACLPICGILMGLGYAMCPSTMQGGDVTGVVEQIGFFLVKAGGALIDHTALLFAIGVGVGMSDDHDGTAGLAALASWLMITNLLSTGAVSVLRTLEEGSTAFIAFSKIENPFIGIIAGIIGALCYNRFKSTKLPDWLSFFSGKRCVAIVAGVVSIIVSAVLLFVWPVLFAGLVALGKGIEGMGALGAGIYAFFNRLLIPFGLHHALNNVFWFDTIGLGDLSHFWNGETSADVSWSLGMYMSGFFPCMMFGIPGAALAMIQSAKSNKKKVAIGLIASILGIAYVLLKNGSDNPHRDLNISTWSAAGITIIGGFVATYLLFNGENADILKVAGFNIGFISPWIAASLGVVSGVIIGGIAEYYTSYDYKPTQTIAQASKEGAALTITQGLSVGMKSCMYPLIVLGITTYVSYAVSGMFGIAMAAVGMLSFVSATVSVDTYGPISDNAGGIAEMSELEPEVREITDKLDSVGNTTAAIGKGFAIGSASLAALSLMVSFLYAFQPEGSSLDLNFTNPLILAGALVGGALPYLFSGMLIEAVANAARKMVEEVRRQFRDIPGILEGKAKPDYKTCIEISSQGALKEMRMPAIISIIFPVIAGFLFGPYFVGGLLIGATLSAIMLAIFTGNAGGAWDNGKKYIESGAIEGQGKGSPAHDAAVVGDTVGDPLKDTVGPSLDILIKIMSTVSLVAAVMFYNYNLLYLIFGIR